jgi:hypothetical protein
MGTDQQSRRCGRAEARRRPVDEPGGVERLKRRAQSVSPLIAGIRAFFNPPSLRNPTSDQHPQPLGPSLRTIRPTDQLRAHAVLKGALGKVRHGDRKISGQSEGRPRTRMLDQQPAARGGGRRAR